MQMLTIRSALSGCGDGPRYMRGCETRSPVPQPAPWIKHPETYFLHEALLPLPQRVYKQPPNAATTTVAVDAVSGDAAAPRRVVLGRTLRVEQTNHNISLANRLVLEGRIVAYAQRLVSGTTEQQEAGSKEDLKVGVVNHITIHVQESSAKYPQVRRCCCCYVFGSTRTSVVKQCRQTCCGCVVVVLLCFAWVWCSLLICWSSWFVVLFADMPFVSVAQFGMNESYVLNIDYPTVSITAVSVWGAMRYVRCFTDADLVWLA